MSDMPPPTIPAGWYPDPQMGGTQRYWTGTEWSEHMAPATTSPAPQVAPHGNGSVLTIIAAVAIIAIVVYGIAFLGDAFG